MSEHAFVKATSDLVIAVDEAFKKRVPLPAFILLYSSIDILSSLTRPVGQGDTNGTIFKTWVRKYLIAGKSFVWNEEDIWGARCGLLHTYTVQSRLSRGGVVRELHYISDREVARRMQERIDPQAREKVMVCLPDLIMAFFVAVDQFGKDVERDPALQAMVFHHAGKLIVHDRVDNPKST